MEGGGGSDEGLETLTSGRRFVLRLGMIVHGITEGFVQLFSWSRWLP